MKTKSDIVIECSKQLGLKIINIKMEKTIMNKEQKEKWQEIRDWMKKIK